MWLQITALHHRDGRIITTTTLTMELASGRRLHEHPSVRDCLDDIALLGAGHDAQWVNDFAILSEIDPRLAVDSVRQLSWYPQLSDGARTKLWGLLMVVSSLSAESHQALLYWIGEEFSEELMRSIVATAAARSSEGAVADHD